MKLSTPTTAMCVAVLAISACSTSDQDSTVPPPLAPGASTATTEPTAVTTDPTPDNEPETSVTDSTSPSNVPSAEQLIDAFTPARTDFDAVRIDDEENELVYETWQASMLDCMTDRGFGDFETTEYSETAGTRIVIRTPIVPDEVEEYGYHLPPRFDSPSPYGPNEQRADAEPDFYAALIGDPDEDTYPRADCRDQMFELVYDETGDFRALGQELGNEVAQISIASGESDQVAAINAQWSDCMNRDGYDYTDPFEPLNRFAGAEDVTDEEIDIRRADIACHLDVDYVATTSGWVADDVNTWFGDNAENIDRYTTLKAAYLDRITQLSADLDAS